MAVAVGTQINQYRIISRLGAGGMGEVYLAQDTKLGRQVALKLLYDNAVQSEDWARRFEQEARAASALNHPNIITIYEVGQIGPSHFISAEYIEGQTLRQHLRLNVMTTGEVLDIAIQTAAALVTAHKAGIIHRDIKPENIMLRPDGYVKVLDFGLAKFTERPAQKPNPSDPDADTQALINTDPGTVMGTVSYMSPEQARGTGVDERTDIFSLGVMLYEMLTGRLPFEGKTPSDVIVSIIGKRPVSLARYSPQTPLELERIVSKSLTKNRDERYQTIKDLLIDLKRLKQRLDVQAELGEEPEQDSERELVQVNSGGSLNDVTTESRKASTRELATGRHTSSAEYIVSGIKRYKKAVLFAVAIIVLASSAFVYRAYTRPIDSIAVLPFKNINPDSSTEHLGDDITENIINSLSQLPNLRVVSHNSVMPYKGQQVDPQAIGHDLNVDAILVGQVSRRGDGVLISAELINVRDKSHMWGTQRPTKFADLLLVPEEITTLVSNTIGLKLSGDEKKKRDAETLYAKGRNAQTRRTADDLKEAIGYFEQATRTDANYALAYAGLADCYNLLATYGALAPTEAFPKAQDAAEKALELNNGLAEAHAALAYTRFRNNWDWSGAEREFKRAISLKDDYAPAHQWYASYLAAMGHFDEAIQETRRTQEIDNTSLIINSHFGLIDYFAHNFDGAIEQCRKTIELDPTFFVARRYLGLSYAQQGKYKEALDEFQKAVAASNSSPLMRAEYAQTLALSGDTKGAQSELDKLKELAKQRYISAYHIAAIYVALKDKDHAFEWLENGFQQRADWMVFLKVDPRFDSLHSEPRFIDLQRRLNLQ
jgi:serine/threonine protein kinase/Tfp pilus assembly protein PilF